MAKAKTKKVVKGGRGLAADVRAAAKAAGLSGPAFVVLRALAADGCPADGLTYRGVEAATGYYSVLTAMLRKQSRRSGADNPHPDSLASKGLVKEVWRQSDADESKSVLHFVATAKGRAVVARVGKAAAG